MAATAASRTALGTALHEIAMWGLAYELRSKGRKINGDLPLS